MDIEGHMGKGEKTAVLTTYGDALGAFELDYFANLLEQVKGNVEQGAVKAGVNTATLYRKIKKYNLR